jgi:mannose-1-phosphate guanylyltransferase/phosphomannomutase
VKAVIMAGGQGTRLRPLTSNQPKPMIPIVNTPCMEHILNLLGRHGFEEVVVTLQFMPQVIQDYFGDGSDWGMKIHYSVEDAPLGTAGSVKLAEEHLDDGRFLVISGDALTDVDLGEVLGFHEEREAEVTMVLKSVENPLEFGIVITEEDGRISRFLEKPAWGQVFSDTINTGIYVLEPQVLEEIPENVEYDFSKELFPKLLSGGRRLYGHVTESYWEDIGTLEQYMKAQRDVLDGRVRGVRPAGVRLRENVYVGRRAQVEDERLEGPVVIGENARVSPEAEIGPYTVLAPNTVVNAGARIERSTIAEGSFIDEGAEVRDALIGRSCYIQARARILERSALGDDVTVGEGATVAPDVKIFPHKEIEAEANVTQSIIYESTGIRTLFRGGMVRGKFNLEITPEFAMRFAESLGSTLEPGTIVTCGRDSSLSARVIRYSIISGLNATGVNVRDLRAAHVGVVRHDVRSGKSSAGVYVRQGEDPQEVQILLYSSDATPVDEAGQRSVEKVYVREEYRRAFLGDIGDIIYPGRVVEQYVERLERALDRERTSGAALVVDFSGGVAELVSSLVFRRLEVDAVVVSGFSNANVARPETGFNLEESLERVSRIVPTVGAAFGCVVGPTGEDVHFVDDAGAYVPPDVMFASFLQETRPERAVIPVNLSEEFAELVRRNGGEVIYSRTGFGNLSQKFADAHADIGGMADGRYLFAGFIPAPDCFVTIGRALEVFGHASLSRVRREFGKSVGNVVRRRVECPWSEKGRVMRLLAEKFGSDPDVVLTDGVKLNLDGGWVLMIPDPDHPFFYVYAESEASEPLAAEYSRLVEELVRST